MDTLEAASLPEYSRVAMVGGEPYETVPHNLYIPPDALEVFLESFEGPLDLLLYLIRYQGLNIIDIPVLKITQQYIEYITLMQHLKLELAAEYLVMAAMLAEIKSNVLLPRDAKEQTTVEEDPRAELVRRLQEYEQFKLAAHSIEQYPRIGRDNFQATVATGVAGLQKPLPILELSSLIEAFQGVLKRVSMDSHHMVKRENLSVRDRMAAILKSLGGQPKVFNYFCNEHEGRQGVVVAFLAILELSKEGLIELIQVEAFTDIWLKAIVAQDDEQ